MTGTICLWLADLASQKNAPPDVTLTHALIRLRRLRVFFVLTIYKPVNRLLYIDDVHSER